MCRPNSSLARFLITLLYISCHLVGRMYVCLCVWQSAASSSASRRVFPNSLHLIFIFIFIFSSPAPLTIPTVPSRHIGAVAAAAEPNREDARAPR